MKRLFLLTLLLLNSFSIQASEAQSWWSKNVRLIAAGSAAATGIVAGISLVFWNMNRMDENAETQRAERYRNAQEAQPALKGKLQTFEQAHGANDQIREKHMLRQEHKSSDKQAIATFAATLKRQQSQLGFNNIDRYLDLYNYGPHRCILIDRNECAACVKGRTSPEITQDRRSQPCVKIDEAHQGIRGTITIKQAAVQKELDKAESEIAEGAENEKRITPAMAAQTAQFRKKVKRDCAIIGCTSAAVSAASLATLLYFKPASGK